MIKKDLKTSHKRLIDLFSILFYGFVLLRILYFALVGLQACCLFEYFSHVQCIRALVSIIEISSGKNYDAEW